MKSPTVNVIRCSMTFNSPLDHCRKTSRILNLLKQSQNKIHMFWCWFLRTWIFNQTHSCLLRKTLQRVKSIVLVCIYVYVCAENNQIHMFRNTFSVDPEKKSRWTENTRFISSNWSSFMQPRVFHQEIHEFIWHCEQFKKFEIKFVFTADYLSDKEQNKWSYTRNTNFSVILQLIEQYQNTFNSLAFK